MGRPGPWLSWQWSCSRQVGNIGFLQMLVLRARDVDGNSGQGEASKTSSKILGCN